MPEQGLPAVTVVLTKLHAGGKFGGQGYKVSGGLHGVGVSVVNALSTHLRVEVHRDGKVHEQEYARGKPVSKVKQIAKPLHQPPQVEWRPREKPTGTITTFAPDPEVFPIIQWDRSIIVQWLRETAYLNKGLFLYITDERDGTDEAF
jgi:DNA gyrase subunit B